ncbi:TnsD family Tn7-like transposition protein [Pseudomonas sp. LB3P93]
MRLSILERLSNGEDKQAVCTSFKVTISTINKLLRSEPHIRELWMAQRKSSNTNAYRQAWLSAMESYPDFGVKRVRSYIPHAYIWLYRNDQLWLNSQIEQLPSDRRGNHSNIDWLKRDAELFESIQ